MNDLDFNQTITSLAPWVNVDRSIGERATYRRNRQIKYPPGSLSTDGVGNVIDRPTTRELLCFGNGVEWLLGRHDQPTRWGDNEPQAKGCALCPVRAHCATVSWERIQNSPQLAELFDDWDDSTATLPPEERYRHPAWAAFVTAYESHSWTDCNESKLSAEREKIEQAQRVQKAAAVKARRKRNRRKQVPREIAEAIAAYHDERTVDLTVLYLSPKPPLWIRNRTLERCLLIADAWQAREMLREAGARASGREVMEWLAERGRLSRQISANMVKRIEEALRRADVLLLQGDWPALESRPGPKVRKAGNGMHPAAVYEQLEP